MYSFMPICHAALALTLTRAKAGPPRDPIFTSLAGLLWSRGQRQEPYITDQGGLAAQIRSWKLEGLG